jgi:hypothetical protein
MARSTFAARLCVQAADFAKVTLLKPTFGCKINGFEQLCLAGFSGVLAGSLVSLDALWVHLVSSWVAAGSPLDASWAVPAELLGDSWASLPPDALQMPSRSTPP